MNAITSAVKGLAATLNRVAGVRGSYSRRGKSCALIDGVLTEREYEVVDDQGIVTVTKSFDWLFRACDLERFLPPDLGDQWEVNTSRMDAAQREYFRLPYEAMEVGSRACFEPHDMHGVMIVVHMKRVPNG